MTRRAVSQLGAAVVLVVGAVLSWLSARTAEHVAPILEGEPSTVSVTYYPPLVVLALALVTAAGVLMVLGLARLRHRS